MHWNYTPPHRGLHLVRRNNYHCWKRLSLCFIFGWSCFSFFYFKWAPQRTHPKKRRNPEGNHMVWYKEGRQNLEKQNMDQTARYPHAQRSSLMCIMGHRACISRVTWVYQSQRQCWSLCLPSFCHYTGKFLHNFIWPQLREVGRENPMPYLRSLKNVSQGTFGSSGKCPSKSDSWSD